MFAYCDHIADKIRTALNQPFKPSHPFKDVSHVNWDLHPEAGYMLSTTKTITLTHANGTKYKVTIEQVE